jgi:hypothetical protein
MFKNYVWKSNKSMTPPPADHCEVLQILLELLTDLIGAEREKK